MKIYKIYKLLHPLTREVRYIGVTTGYLSQRFSQHKHAALKKNVGTYVAKWIRFLYKEGLYPTIELVEECNSLNWEDREKYWIKQYDNLTNTHEGGKGVVIDRKTDSIQRSANGHKKKVVILDFDYNLVKECNSVGECAKFLNRGYGIISNVLNPRWKAKSAANHIILYKEDYEAGTYIKDNYRGQKRKTYQYDLEGKLLHIFDSVTEALNIVKPCKYVSGIFEAVKKKSKCGGYFWSYTEIQDIKLFKK